MTPELALVGYLPRDLLLSARLRRAKLGRPATARARRSPIGRRRSSGCPSRIRPTRDGRSSTRAALAPRRPRRTALPQGAAARPTTSSTRTATSSRSTARRRWTSAAAALGISICEDIWNDRDFWKRRRYHHDPVEELVRAGAQAIVNLSASPFSVGKHARREEMLGSMAAQARRAARLRQPVRRQRRPRVRRPQLRRSAATGTRSRADGRSSGDVVICDLDSAAPIGPRGRSRRLNPRSGARWCSARATTPASAASRASCSGSRAASTRR